MNIPSKENAILEVQNYLGVTLTSLPNKQIFYKGKLPDGRGVLLCTPQSKLYPKGNAWVDLTNVQVSLLKETGLSIVAFRLDSNKIYYLFFPELEPYLIEKAMVYNKKEGNHWKIHIWPNEIKVNGNIKELKVKSFDLNAIAK